MKILLIDDNSDITKMLQKYMTIKGHSCTIANTGQSGLDLINNQTFDVIILDIAMPTFSGNDVIDALHKSGKIKNQNIITLTASMLTGDIEAVLKNKGVHSCLKKPIDPDVLLDHIQQFGNKNKA
jgi:two-component system, OmpR family, response regulator